MYKARMLFFLGSLLEISLAFAQTVPVVTSAYEKESTVDGVGDPAAGPITIVDLSYEVETRIGSGNVSPDGSFTAIVKPGLIVRNRLVAVDRNGLRSSVFTVAPARPGSVPGYRPE